jgi:hypothetical protein
MMRNLLLAVLLAVSALAADRDFLTTNEVEQVRLAQEPNARLALYANIARDRVDLLDDLLKKEKAGRSTQIHETLEDYTKIIETIDIVADDALSRKVDITEGLSSVADAEEDFLKRLEKIEAAPPKDVARYRFVLETAIETTADSLEVNLEDLGDRRMKLAERQERERKKMESMMTPEMAQEREKVQEELAEAEKERKKAPTLFRKGEKEAEERKPE